LQDSNDNKVRTRGVMVWEISTYQTNKTKNLPTFINKCPQGYDPQIRGSLQRIGLPCIYNIRKFITKCCMYYVETKVSRVDW